MKALHVAFSVLLGALAPGRVAFGQGPAAEASISAALAAARRPYDEAFASHSQLFSGREYVDYAQHYHTRTGHQFFLMPEKQPGSLDYNGHHFRGLELRYDVVLDQVVLSQPTSPLMLRPINENVREFVISGHRFARLVADSASAGVIRTGYYEVLLDGTVQVLARRAKSMQEHLSQPYVNVEFTPSDKLFIKKAGRYFLVAGKGSVVRLFADRGKEIQQYLQEHKLKFRKARREADVMQLATYYCSLPPR